MYYTIYISIKFKSIFNNGMLYWRIIILKNNWLLYIEIYKLVKIYKFKNNHIFYMDM